MFLSRVAAVAFLGLSPCQIAAASGTGADGTTPIFVSGARTVDIRNTSGYLARYTSIPSSSVFATEGGSGQACSFVAGGDGVTSDGQQYRQGQTVYSQRWLFVEGEIVSFGEAAIVNPTQSRGPLSTAVRTFMVFCDSRDHLIAYLIVYPQDPMLNPRSRLDLLYNAMHLEQPRVWQNPVVDRWGGLVTRYPAWLAIQASAWRPQQSNAETWRGWLLYLYSTPIAMDFHVVFTPDPEEPSTPFDGIIPCVAPGSTAVGDGVSFPRMLTPPEQTIPGVNWFCMWTPPGPGSVSIQARITYRVLFWANGFTEQLPDYQWVSPAAVFPTGELAVVNTRD